MNMRKIYLDCSTYLKSQSRCWVPQRSSSGSQSQLQCTPCPTRPRCLNPRLSTVTLAESCWTLVLGKEKMLILVRHFHTTESDLTVLLSALRPSLRTYDTVFVCFAQIHVKQGYFCSSEKWNWNWEKVSQRCLPLLTTTSPFNRFCFLAITWHWKRLHSSTNQSILYIIVINILIHGLWPKTGFVPSQRT